VPNFKKLLLCNAGKADIMKFIESNGASHDWMTIRNKVVNERSAFLKRKALKLDSITK